LAGRRTKQLARSWASNGPINALTAGPGKSAPTAQHVPNLTTPAKTTSRPATVSTTKSDAEEYLYDCCEALGKDQIGFVLADAEKDGRMRDVVGQDKRGSDWVDCGRSVSGDLREVREVDVLEHSKDVDTSRGEGAAGSAVSKGLGQALPRERNEDME
jgi:hypothetical protein